MVEAYPEDTVPRRLHRDRDRIYGAAFHRRVAGMGIAEVLSAPASPWQNPFVERVIGSIRQECLDNVIVLSESHLRRVLTSYRFYYHQPDTSRFGQGHADRRRGAETAVGPSSPCLK